MSEQELQQPGSYNGVTLNEWREMGIKERSELMKDWSKKEKDGLLQFMNYERQAEQASMIRDLVNLEFDDFMTLKTQARYKLTDRTEPMSKRLSESTELVANLILTNNHIYTTRDTKNPEMYIYHEGIYVPQAVTYIEEICRQVYTDLYNSNLVKVVTDKVMSETYVDPKEFFRNTPAHELVCENCVIDLDTGETKSFSPDTIHFNRIPIVYDSTADCPNIKQFLTEIVETQEDVNVLQELFGFCLYKEYFLEKAFMLWGKGRNGKSKYLDLIRYLVGWDNTAAISLHQFSNDDYSTARLHNKMVNLAGDISNKPLKETDQFKGLVGKDLQTANRKHLNHIDFVNYAKMIFCANEPPTTYDNSDGFWERWEMVDFPYQFLPQDEYDSYTSSEREEKKICLQKPQVIKGLISDEELSGLLNYALEGLARLQANNDFSTGRSKDDIRIVWTRRSDSFYAYCLENIVPDFDSRILKNDLRRHYSNYCRQTNSNMRPDKHIKKILSESFGAGDRRISIGESQEYAWEGVRFKEQTVSMNTLGEYIISRPKGSSVIAHSKDSERRLSLLSRIRLVIGRSPDGVFLDDVASSVGEDVDNVTEIVRMLESKGEVFQVKPDKYKVMQ